MPYQIPKPADALEVGDIFEFKDKPTAGCFIVNWAGYGGGSDGHDCWPDAWLVHYMQIPNQGPNNIPRRFKMTHTEEIEACKRLSQGSPFTDNTPPDKIKKLGKMDRTVTVSYDKLKIFDPSLRKRGSLTST